MCFLRAVLCGVWHIVTNSGSILVNFGAKSSEYREANFVLPVEILLKRVGFIVLTLTGKDNFSIEKTISRRK